MKKTASLQNNLRAIFPGTFDPITYAHIDLIERAAHIFPEVIVAVAANLQKAPWLPHDKRIAIATDAFQQQGNIQVIGFEGLLVDFAKAQSAQTIVRGLRAVSDFEYEYQLAGMNRRLSPDIETIFLTPSEKHATVSSSLVRQIYLLGGDITQFVPEAVLVAIADSVRC